MLLSVSWKTKRASILELCGCMSGSYSSPNRRARVPTHHLFQHTLIREIQGILALTIEDLGMSLTRMNNIADSARFLDNVDLTFSLDSRSTTSQQLTSIEVGAKPIVFRASYHDINLIMNITNRALEVYGNTANARAQKPEPSAKSVIGSTAGKSGGLMVTTKATSHPIASAHVITSKEQVRPICYLPGHC